jgi:hypothetical protein
MGLMTEFGTIIFHRRALMVTHRGLTTKAAWTPSLVELAGMTVTRPRASHLVYWPQGLGVPANRCGGVRLLHQAGHTETVFDCAFSPTDADTLATASYDGSIKAWNVNGMRLKQTLFGTPLIRSAVMTLLIRVDGASDLQTDADARTDR